MIGIVFGTTLDVAHDKLNLMSKEYESFWKINIEKVISYHNEYTIIFSNGDIWHCVEANGFSSRGRRCNIALIDKNISKEEISSIILTCIIKYPYGTVDNN